MARAFECDDVIGRTLISAPSISSSTLWICTRCRFGTCLSSLVERLQRLPFSLPHCFAANAAPRRREVGQHGVNVPRNAMHAHRSITLSICERCIQRRCRLTRHHTVAVHRPHPGWRKTIPPIARVCHLRTRYTNEMGDGIRVGMCVRNLLFIRTGDLRYAQLSQRLLQGL